MLLVILTNHSSQCLFLVEMLQKECAFLDERFSMHLACWGSKCTVTTVQTSPVSVIHGHPYLHNKKSCGAVDML